MSGSDKMPLVLAGTWLLGAQEKLENRREERRLIQSSSRIVAYPGA